MNELRRIGVKRSGSFDYDTPGYFHQFGQKFISGDHGDYVVTLAIVEYEHDGRVEMIDPERIKFEN